MAEEEKSIKEKLLELIGKGYKRGQLINDLEFAERTVDEALKDYRENIGEPPQDRAITEGGKHDLMKLGQKDMVAPESIVGSIILPRDSSTGEVWRDGYLSCMYQVCGISRLLQQIAAGQADVVTSQMKVWREAKESNQEIAREAARQAVESVLGYLEEKTPKPAPPPPPPKDMNEMFTKRIEKLWEIMEHTMEQKMNPGLQAGKPPQGWEYETQSSAAAPVSKPENAGAAAVSTPHQGNPNNWEQEHVENKEKQGG